MKSSSKTVLEGLRITCGACWPYEMVTVQVKKPRHANASRVKADTLIDTIMFTFNLVRDTQAAHPTGIWSLQISNDRPRLALDTRHLHADLLHAPVHP